MVRALIAGLSPLLLAGAAAAQPGLPPALREVPTIS